METLEDCKAVLKKRLQTSPVAANGMNKQAVSLTSKIIGILAFSQSADTKTPPCTDGVDYVTFSENHVIVASATVEARQLGELALTDLSFLRYRYRYSQRLIYRFVHETFLGASAKDVRSAPPSL
ncbi:MAG: hypothetical protein QNJ84_12275 [Alphaproteobacteria bacterium]|nr:hypothetical protein [Alphaproteobacteria bacterium]